jgi:hypothetical protein
MPSDRKKEWKLRKGNSIAKIKSLEKFAALLYDLGIINIRSYLEISYDVDAQVSMIASTLFEAENDNPE